MSTQPVVNCIFTAVYYPAQTLNLQINKLSALEHEHFKQSIMVGKSLGKLSLGRLRMKWYVNIKMCFWDAGCEDC